MRNPWGQSSTGLPFLCATCHSLYDQPGLLVECLRRHEENERRMDEMQAMLRTAREVPTPRISWRQTYRSIEAPA